MLEKPKFVPMARPYASHIPNVFISLLFRALVLVSPSDNMRSPLVEINQKRIDVRAPRFVSG